MTDLPLEIELDRLFFFFLYFSLILTNFINIFMPKWELPCYFCISSFFRRRLLSLMRNRRVKEREDEKYTYFLTALAASHHIIYSKKTHKNLSHDVPYLASASIFIIEVNRILRQEKVVGWSYLQSTSRFLNPVINTRSSNECWFDLMNRYRRKRRTFIYCSCLKRTWNQFLIIRNPENERGLGPDSCVFFYVLHLAYLYSFVVFVASLITQKQYNKSSSRSRLLACINNAPYSFASLSVSLEGWSWLNVYQMRCSERTARSSRWVL